MSEPSKEAGAKLPSPYPVSQGMRTRRLLPRLLALILVVASAAAFAAGTNVLRSHERADLTPLDRLFSGNSYWKGHRIDSARCSAFLKTSFAAPPRRMDVGAGWLENRPSFGISGALRYALSGEVRTARFSAEFTFDPLLRLNTMHGSAEADSMVVRFSMPEEAREVAVELQAGSLTQTFAFNRPESIYLVDRGEGRFSLRIPPAAQRAFFSSDSLVPRFGMQVSAVQAEEFKACRRKVKAGAPDVPPLVDLGDYSDLQTEALRGAVASIFDSTGHSENDSTH